MTRRAEDFGAPPGLAGVGTAERFDPVFLQQLRTEVAGDSPLMSAIRSGNRATIDACLASAPDLSAANTRGETALFLALRLGEYDLVEQLYRAGARDADDLICDARYTRDPALDVVLGRGDPESGIVEHLLSAAVGPTTRVLKFDELKKVRSHISRHIEQHHPRSMAALSPDDGARAAQALRDLRETGVAGFDGVLSRAQLDDIHRHFSTKPIYAGHAPGAAEGQPLTFLDIQRKGGQGCYSSDAVLSAPHLLDLANSPLILHLVTEYLACKPTIFSANVLWSCPHDRSIETWTTESMHRDYDDFAFVVLFIYLTDVELTSGAHRFYRGTHDLDRTADALRRRFDPEVAALIARDLYRSIGDGHGRIGLVEELLGDQISDITGPAGTAFLEDTYGLHRALSPRQKPRLMAWFRYGMQLTDSWPATQGGTGPYDPYINRYLPAMRRFEIAVHEGIPRLIVDGYEGTGYNICSLNQRYYAVHQDEGPTDLANISARPTKRPVYFGGSADEVIAQLRAALGC